MIFVTVGSTRNERLVRHIDQFASNTDETVIVQIGKGMYKPDNCEYFDYAPSLENYFDQANLIVGGGGVGTIYDLLLRGKRLIAVTNSHVPDPMQEQLPHKLALQGYLIWCNDVKNIEDAIQQAKTFIFKRYHKSECWIEKIIAEYLYNMNS